MPHLRIALVSLSAALLSACVVAPYPRRVVYAQPVYAQPAYSGPVYVQPPVGLGDVVVDMPPPASYVEVVPPLPYPGAVWIGGSWGWGGGRHVWEPGRWEHARPGYQWRPHAWVAHGGRWHLQRGGWARF